MKFTKEDAYKDLVAKMTSKGEKLNLSERSFNEQLEQLIPLIANDETELSDFIEKCLPFFNTANANVRNDVSLGIKEYKESNPQPHHTTASNGKDDILSEEWRQRIEKMEAKVAEAEKKERESAIRKEILSKLKDKGVKNNEWAETLISEVSITDDFDVEAKVESYLKIYNKIQSDIKTTTSPEGAGGNGGGNSYIKDVIQRAGAIEKTQLQSR